MHTHNGLRDRTYLVTLMSGELSHQIVVETACTCDLREWIMTLPDLPFVPASMSVQPVLLGHRYHSSSSRLP